MTPGALESPAVAAPADRDILVRLGGDVRASAWELALEVVGEGLREGTIAALARLGEMGQIGDVPTFVSELGRELADCEPARLQPGGVLAARARDHAREREALGFAPRDIVTEFLLLRRVLWRFVTRSGVLRETGDVVRVERRLNETIDRLVTECVVAYFDRATSELARRARADPLTGLLNHQAFTDELEEELERARRYEHGLTLVFIDIDRFKTINDTLGHPEGDRVLRSLAVLLRETLRASDLAGRMGGDEFAACLLEGDVEAAGRFLSRLMDRIDELRARGELPAGFSLSPGVAHFPSDGVASETLFRLADARLYEVKRSRV
jgi:diguanylate cyclase (GGDEF)-like protein